MDAAPDDPLGTYACARCVEAFARGSHLALHLGRAHGLAALDADERARYEAALAAEEAWLAHFRRHVKGGLHALPAVAIFLLILLLVGVSGLPIFFGFILLPGAAAFAALLYYKAYTA